MPRHNSKTIKTLVKQIHEQAIEESNSAVTIKLNGSVYTLTGAFVGLAAGKEYAAVVIEDQTLLVELDSRGSMRNAKLIKEPSDDLRARIAADLLPEPEEPEEVKAARAALAAFKLPKGYRLHIDAKGNATVVQDDSAPGITKTRQRAPKGSVPPKVTKPLIVKGLKVRRNKSGVEHTVTGVDMATGYVILQPSDGTEDYRTKGLRGNGATAPVPVFWANWSEVVA